MAGLDGGEIDGSQSGVPPRSSGNFEDFENLLEQLGAPPVFELGSPLPEEKFLLKMRAGKCPAAHNRALFDEPND